jgi:glutamate-ammonia-ligase adenylyltransferase
VDLRLRPSPEVTPIALPVDAAISYYESSALPLGARRLSSARGWWRAIGARRYFLDAIHPFVWRRSLDFGSDWRTPVDHAPHPRSLCARARLRPRAST